MVSILRKKDGKISVKRLAVAAVVVSIVISIAVTVISTYIGTLIGQNIKKKKDGEDQEPEVVSA